jgi:EmrB/QacA subfamily drug resistance transporter
VRSDDGAVEAAVNVTEATKDLDPSVWKIVAVTVIGSFLSQLNATVVTVSLASLASELHSSLATIQWVTSGYLLALTLALPLNGWLVDRMGAKAVYLWCFTAFTVSSALCGLAWSVDSLIAFRVLQGIGGGLLAPMTQLMLVRVAGGHLSRVVGYAAVPVMLAPLLGPIVAGAILEYASWRWLFLVNLPIGVFGTILAALLLPDDRQHIRPRDLDWTGFALLSPGLALFLYGTDHCGDRVGLWTVTAAIALLILFAWTTRRKGAGALIDLRLFGIETFAASAVTQFLSNGVLFAGQMLIPIYLLRACGRSPAEAGWLMVPQGLGMMCTYPWMGAVTKRFGICRVSGGGALVALLGTLLLVYLANYDFNFVVLATALFFRGVGQVGMGIPSISAAYGSVAPHDISMASTTLNIVQRLGGPMFTTLCATFLGWMLESQPLHHASLNPYASALLLLAALHSLVLVAALRLPAR